MKKQTALALLCGWALTLPCAATTLNDIATLILPPPPGAATKGWARLNKLPGVKWLNAAPTKGPGFHARTGRLTLDGIGKVSISFNGPPADAQSAHVHLPEAVDKREFAAVLGRWLPGAQLKELRGGCKDEGVLGGSTVHQALLPGVGKVYITTMSAPSRQGMDSSLSIERQLNKHWQCPS